MAAMHGEGHAGMGPHGEGHTAMNMQEHVDGLFAKMDKNSDRMLSKEEVGEHHLAKKFDMADADADGQISYDEMIAFGTKMHAMMEKKMAAPAPAADAAAAPAADADAAAAPAP